MGADEGSSCAQSARAEHPWGCTPLRTQVSAPHRLHPSLQRRLQAMSSQFLHTLSTPFLPQVCFLHIPRRSASPEPLS